jgi:ATP-binding cassette subfamily B protein
MSRATVDLQAVRFFLGYGLVFILQSALTILLAGAAMFAVQPGLAAVSLIPVPIVVFVSARYGHFSRPALQELQQRIAELTADVEENIGGVAVGQGLRARGPPARPLPRPGGAGVGPGDGHTPVCRPSTTRSSASSPQLGLAAILFFGRRQVIDGRLSVGEFSAFYAYLLMLLSPMRTLGISLGLAQRATAAGARVYQILDREPRIVSAPDAPPLPEGSGHVELRGVDVAVRGRIGSRRCTTSPRRPGGTTVALVGATASGKTTLVQLIPRLYDVSAGASSSTAPTCATSTSPRCAPP